MKPMKNFVELTILSDPLAIAPARQVNTVSVDSIKRVMEWSDVNIERAKHCKVTVVFGNQTHEWHVEACYSDVLALIGRAQ